MKKILTIAILCAKLFAVDAYEVDQGDIYYINSGMFGDDRRVIVIRVNTSTRRVKVKTANGDTEWVNSSNLLTKQQNEDKNDQIGINATAIGLGLLFMGSDN